MANTSSYRPPERQNQSTSLDNWLDDLQSTPKAPVPYAGRPESISDQIAALPNSEKLSPFEKFAYKALPGIAQSKFGMALESFAKSPAGKVLGYLDVFAEGVERTLGLLAQYRDHDPLTEFKLKDAWTAGSLFYDVSRMPRVQYDKDGNVTGVRVDNDMPGTYALTEARKLISQGKSLEEVRDLMYGNMGALAMRAQLNDMLGHIAVDPLNYILGWLKPVEKIHAVRSLALANKIDVPAIRVMEATARAQGNLEDAAKFAAAIAKAESEGTAITRFDRFAINLTGGVPYLDKNAQGVYQLRDVAALGKGKQILAKLNPFALTPQARASELLDMVAANVGEYLIRGNWNGNPEDFADIMAKAARGGIGSEWGHLTSTIQGRTTQAFMAGADGAAKNLVLEWKTYEAERTVLGKILPFMPGEDERKLWRLANTSPDALFKKVLAFAEQPGGESLMLEIQAGRLTRKTIDDIAKVPLEVPLMREEFFVKGLVSVQDVAAQQSVLQFGIKEKGLITKWSDMLKAVETLPFIKVNPANAVRNVVNNDVTLISRGLFGTMSGSAIDAFWEGKYVPPQFMRAFGFQGIGEFDAGIASKAIVEALEGKQASLPQKLKLKVQNIKLGAADFSKSSQYFEARASKRASTMGWIQFHQQYWNPRTGFTSISKNLDPATLEKIEAISPGLAETLDDIAQASGGDAAKFADLMQTQLDHNVTTIFKNTADRLGFKLDDVFGTDTIHRLQEGLPDAIAKGKVKEFVAGVRAEMEAHVDQMFNQHIENLPGIVGAQVQAGGPLQYHRIFGKAVDELWGGNVEHAIRMSTLNETLDYARQSGDYRKVSALWKQIKIDSDTHFTRVWKKFDAYQAGLQQGAKNAGLKYPQKVAESFKGVQKGWKEFFDFRNGEIEKFFASIDEGGVPAKRFEQIQNEIDTLYSAMIKEEDKLFQNIDDMMTKSLPDKIQQKMYRNYRDMAAKLRVTDREKTAEFFKKVRTASSEDAPDMWQTYWSERMGRLEQMRQLDVRGSAAIQGDAKSTSLFMGETGASDVEPQNVYELASRFGISSATKKGVRNDRRILTTVNKYAKENATDVQIVQNAKLPDDVKTTFTAWDEAKQAVKEAQKSKEDITIRQPAIQAAKDAEKAARQAYNDALVANKIDGGMVDKLIKNREFMEPSTIPMDVARKAFETRAAEQTAEATAAAEKAFIPDAEKLFPDPMPIETGLSEMNYGRGFAAMDALVEETTAQVSKKSALLKDLPEDVQKRIGQWANQVNDESAGFRAAGVQYAAFRRDSALLNYNRRSNFDNMVGHFAPFAFWTTHSVANWAIHSLDRPAMLTSYFRARKFFETAGLQDQKVPQRLKGNIRVSMPFAPDWMGDTFVNPMRFLLPFDGFLMPWEQAQAGKFRTEQKVKDTLDQMVESGAITEDQYNEAVQSQSGDVWDAATAQVQEGGDNYDAMDFINMTMTPHAPLMWAYNAARGTPNEIGPFTPMSRTVRNVATMMGVDDWSNSPYNVEGRIRKSLGLPAYDRWDDYRVARMISDMAADGKYGMDKINEAMQVASLVESGKMTSEDAVAQNAIYKEATKRANQESAGGWAGTVLSAIGIPVRAYPTGEQKQRELAEAFSKAYDEYDKGDVKALSDFFDEHPEYESRLALFKSPEERLKNFMVDNLWARWNELPEVTQDEMKEQMGDSFSTYFMDKETRSYDTLSPLQLQVYLKLMGGKPVGTLTADQEVMIELNQLKLTEPETAWRVQTFYDMRNEEHPDWYTTQNKYYALSTKAEKAKFLRENPDLKDYWNDRRDWMTKNPDLVRFLTDDQKQLAKFAKMRRNPEVAVPTREEIMQNFSPEMQELLSDWQSGENLPPSLSGYLQGLAYERGISPTAMMGILTNRNTGLP